MVRRAAFWTFSSQISNFVIQFATSIVVARLLSPKEMGVYAIAIAAIGIVQLFGSFNVGAYVIREGELSAETLDTAFTLNAIISAALGLIIFVSSYFAGWMLGDRMVVSVMQLLSMSPLISILSFRPSIMMQRAIQFRGISVLATISSGVAAFVTIVAAYEGQSSLSPAIGTVAASLVGTVGTVGIGWSYCSFRTSVYSWRPIMAFGLRLMSIGGVAATAVRISDLIVGHMLGLAALGLYSRATNLASMLFQNVYGSATRVIFVKLSEAQRNDDRVAETYLHGLRLITGVMGPINLGLAVLAGPAIHLLYGAKWIGAATPFAFLMIAQFISLSFAMNWELFVIRDELKAQTKIEIIRSVVGVISQTIGCFFSLAAVAASSIFDALVSLWLYNPHMSKLARKPRVAFYSIYAEVVGLSALATMPAFILMLIRNWQVNTPPIEVGASVLAGSVLWAAAIAKSKHPLRNEVERLFSRKKRTRIAIDRSR